MDNILATMSCQLSLVVCCGFEAILGCILVVWEVEPVQNAIHLFYLSD